MSYEPGKGLISDAKILSRIIASCMFIFSVSVMPCRTGLANAVVGTLAGIVHNGSEAVFVVNTVAISAPLFGTTSPSIVKRGRSNLPDPGSLRPRRDQYT